MSSFELDQELKDVYQREFGKSAEELEEERRRKRQVKPVIKAQSVKTDKKGNPIYPKKDTRERCLIVDGYNMIFASGYLRDLGQKNIDAARDALADALCNYQGYHGGEVILVFDAYRVAGHGTEIFDYHNIHVVYTKEAETADRYIERFVHDHVGRYDITVVTSDGLEQIIIRGAGCGLISAREFKEEVERAKERMREVIDN